MFTKEEADTLKANIFMECTCFPELAKMIDRETKTDPVAPTIHQCLYCKALVPSNGTFSITACPTCKRISHMAAPNKNIKLEVKVYKDPRATEAYRVDLYVDNLIALSSQWSTQKEADNTAFSCRTRLGLIKEYNVSLGRWEPTFQVQALDLKSAIEEVVKLDLSNVTHISI